MHSMNINIYVYICIRSNIIYIAVFIYDPDVMKIICA